MSSKTEKKTQSLTSELAKDALSVAITTAAGTAGSYVALVAIGWVVQKYNEKKDS